MLGAPGIMAGEIEEFTVFAGVTTHHDPPRLMVVVAHPDDETFGCGSLLLTAVAVGWRTTVVCATRGEGGEPTAETDLSHATLGDVREAELRRAAAVMGVAEVILLGFGDSGMDGEPPTGSLAAADEQLVVDAVAQVVDTEDPDLIITLDGTDGHRDHVRVRDAAARVATSRGTPAYLHCIPRSVMARWVEHMVSMRPDMKHLRLADLGTPDEDVDLVIDTSAHLTAREQAMAEHRSQTSPFDGLPEDLRRSFLTRDYLRVAPTS
jgi:LmbE family N-acetylglucosaminyl deacetylase